MSAAAEAVARVDQAAVGAHLYPQSLLRLAVAAADFIQGQFNPFSQIQNDGQTLALVRNGQRFRRTGVSINNENLRCITQCCKRLWRGVRVCVDRCVLLGWIEQAHADAAWQLDEFWLASLMGEQCLYCCSFGVFPALTLAAAEQSKLQLYAGVVTTKPGGCDGLWFQRAHDTSQEYPFSSSSSARVLSPDWTMRPSARTCT